MKYLSEVKGKSGTVARVVAYSQAENSGTKLITFEYEAARRILAQINTHKILCGNAESSRAVPVKNRIKRIRENPYIPPHFGCNKAGMQAGEEIDTVVKFNNDKVNVNGYRLDEFDYLDRDKAWSATANIVADLMEAWDNAGYSKEVVNGIGENFTTIKGVLSGTEWDNWFHLRRDKHADPAIKELADCMWKAKCEVEEKGLIEILKAGEWHTPYVEHWRASDGDAPLEYISNNLIISLEEALKTSAVACGQVSFRKLDTSEETVERVWNRLMGGEAVHASVTQHQGTPIGCYTAYHPDLFWPRNWEKGVSHMDKRGDFWSAQFKHWIMFRKTIPNEVCNKYVPRDGE